ncbi:hypothetical protein A0O34_21665 [Chryseobacterium glaciei]|uniref:Knr4/Smi1-like domain-containing protein n=1 Tax=Chryseobacterium glaciei TaxID=1685010 RepID=A0A172Y184_9FLAO|nr:SMI1/KNR4 family protein [Chryseobacterium glaciei]ANF52971.1 hypothetical protein A0O34_21665 [Chryseobacterium glaciei]
MNNNFEYPDDYLSYVNKLQNNEIFTDSGYIELFQFEELDEINKEYETETYVPDFINIGTNSGGVGIFINKKNGHIYSIPFVGMDEKDAILLGSSFSEFIYKFENNESEII